MINSEKIIEAMLEKVNTHGIEGMAEVFQVLLNHAMQIERAQVLQAQPYERTHTRRGYANGFLCKRV